MAKTSEKIEENIPASTQPVESTASKDSAPQPIKAASESLKNVGSGVQKSTQAKDDKATKSSILNKSFSFGSGASPLDVALSIRHLSIMLKSGMPLSDGVRVLAEQADNKKLRECYSSILEDIQAGRSMSEGMKRYPKVFSQVIVSVISVGEQGGTLEKNLLFLAEFLKKNHELSRKVKGALVYPIIVFGLTVMEMSGVIFFVLPKMEALFSSFPNTPAFTVAVMSGATFIRTNILYIVLAAVVAYLLFWLFKRTESGKKFKDRFDLSFPIIKNLNKKHILTNFSRTLGILLESGIPISVALGISGETVGNSVYAKILNDVFSQVKEGQNLADSLGKYPQHFPATYTKMIQIAEETGTLEENLFYLHEFYAEEVEEMSNNLAQLLEPILLIFIGLMIGLLAVVVIGPIYQLTGSINE